MKKLELFTLLFTFLLMSFVNSQAQKSNELIRDNDRALNHLNLSEAQREKMKELRFANEETKIEIMSQLKKNKLELKRILTEVDLDEDKLNDLIENRSILSLSLKKSNLDMWLKIRNILDDDQKKIWVKHFNSMGNRSNKHWEQGNRNHSNELGHKNRQKKRRRDNNIYYN